MLTGGGTLFLDDDGRKIGPGHFSFTDENGQDKFSYHYYDGDRVGAPTFALRDLYWTSDEWPSIAAVNPNWTGATGSSWSDTANCTNNIEPNGVGHVANFAALSARPVIVELSNSRTVGTVNFRGIGGYTINATGGSTLTLSDVAGENATLNVAESSHTIAAPIVAVGQLGVNVTPTASTLSLGGPISGPGLTKYGDGKLTLAGVNSAFSGSIFVKYGQLSVTGSVSTGSFSSVGQIVGESAVLSVQDSGAFTANGDLNIGDTGDNTTPATGALYISDQASVVVGTGGGLYVGAGFFANTRAEGSVFQSGGTLTVNRPADGSFVIGGRNSSNANGAYNLSGGTVAANTNVFVGGRGNGSVNQTGGSFNASQFLAIGRFTGSTGDWTISEGTLNQSNSGTWLLVGEEGAGTLTLQTDGQVNANGTMQIGYRATGVGTINLDVGVLTAHSIVRGAGSATVNFNGGVLRAGANNGALMQGLTGANVKVGGARIYSQSFDVTIAQPFLHASALGATPDGGLTKQGSGVLRLTGANTYTGGTTIEAGTLLANNIGGSATGAGTVVVQQGGILGGNGISAGTTTVLSGGELAPGNSIGRLIVGGVVRNSGSTVFVELSGSGGFAGVDYDQLMVNGIANLGGDLVVDLISGFAPDPDDSFAILTAGSLAGAFDNAANGDFVDEADGQGAFRVRYDAVPNAVVLTDYQSVPFLAGDYNGNGVVDAADYTVWRNHLGSAAGTLINDPNVTDISAAQYATWRDNFGASRTTIGAAASAQVPEPNAVVLVGCCVMLSLRFVRRKAT